MTKKEKRLQKIRQNRRNVRYDDLVALLDDYGFTVRSGKGSHVIAMRTTKEGIIKITLVKPHQSKFVKVAYISRILSEIDKIAEQQTAEKDENANDSD